MAETQCDYFIVAIMVQFCKYLKAYALYFNQKVQCVEVLSFLECYQIGASFCRIQVRWLHKPLLVSIHHSLIKFTQTILQNTIHTLCNIFYFVSFLPFLHMISQLFVLFHIKVVTASFI